MLLAVFRRNNLVVDIGARLHTDSRLAGFRRLHSEGIDDCIIISSLSVFVCHCIVYFTGGRSCLGIELRRTCISRALLCLDIFNTGKVERHLETCGTLVVFDRPVDRQLFTRGNLYEVVVFGIDSSRRIVLTLRDKVIDDRICRCVSFHCRRRCSNPRKSSQQ